MTARLPVWHVRQAGRSEQLRPVLSFIENLSGVFRDIHTVRLAVGLLPVRTLLVTSVGTSPDVLVRHPVSSFGYVRT